jgi:hypothetical protein
VELGELDADDFAIQVMRQRERLDEAAETLLALSLCQMLTRSPRRASRTADEAARLLVTLERHEESAIAALTSREYRDAALGKPRWLRRRKWRRAGVPYPFPLPRSVFAPVRHRPGATQP